MLLSKETILIKTIQNKFDGALFETLIMPYFQYGFRVIYRILYNNADSEGVLQNALIKVLKNINKFKFKSNFKTWFASICYNEAITFLNQNKNKSFLSIDNGNTETKLISNEQIAEDLDRQDNNSKLGKAIKMLNPKSRLILLNYYKEEISIKEIAEIMAQTESAIKITLHRTRQELKQLLNLTR